MVEMFVVGRMKFRINPGFSGIAANTSQWREAA